MKNKIGKGAFVVGFLITIISGFLINFISLGWILFILFLLGFIMGSFNIEEKKISLFLLGVIALVIFGLAGIETISFFIKNIDEYSPIGISLTIYFETFFRTFIVFVASAGVVVANKAVFSASNKPNLFKSLSKKFNFL